jgi:hypothetical protein
LLCRVEISKSSPGSEVASNLVTNHLAKHHLTSSNEPLSKRQKSLKVDSGSSLTWVGESSIEAVQESYLSAIRDGRLKYRRVPQQVSESAGLKPWDPYVLTVALVPRALLKKDKVESITESVKKTIQTVPKAVEWIAKTQHYRLTPEDVKMVLQRAFVNDESSSIQQSKQVDKLPPILGIAAKALRRAAELKDEDGDFQREEAILRMVAFASMEVSIVAEEATEDQVSNRHRSVCRADTRRSISGWSHWLVGKIG